MRHIIPVLTKRLKNFGRENKYLKEYYHPKSYSELIKEIAKLSYLNRDHIIYYRGQQEDYLNKAGNTTIYPSIYRDYLSKKEILNKFFVLRATANELTKIFENKKIEGARDLSRSKYIQWSILQHYEVCNTPLLDITQSLNVALSFALKDKENDGILYILGLPYLTNRISINSEQETINIRLLSICPPDALRPYYQQGYLCGTTDIEENYKNKTELDFNKRLLLKIKIDKNIRNNIKTRLYPENLLFPKKDKIGEICKGLRIRAEKNMFFGKIGKFIVEWAEIETIINEFVGPYNKSFGKKLNDLRKKEILKNDEMMKLDQIRIFRNKIVHQNEIENLQKIDKYLAILSSIKKELRNINY